ncbi:MAG TPA: hypothetical protein VNB49_16450 [Candidatus Dormibacteraeota bacterium]|nr:hypothetical protein [Candidatus Dormibacteraeota bacterium]
MWLARLGIVIGVGEALANLVKSMLFKVTTTDVITFTGVAIVLTGGTVCELPPGAASGRRRPESNPASEIVGA